MDIDQMNLHPYFKTISATLGIFILVTGLGIAIRLTQQNQDYLTKALVPTPTPSPITIIKKGDRSLDGDFNEDGRVDGVDYVIWINNYL